MSAFVKISSQLNMHAPTWWADLIAKPASLASDGSVLIGSKSGRAIEFEGSFTLAVGGTLSGTVDSVAIWSGGKVIATIAVSPETDVSLADLLAAGGRGAKAFFELLLPGDDSVVRSDHAGSRLIGGAGDDAFLCSPIGLQAGTTLDGGPGGDTADYTAVSGPGLVIDLFAGITTGLPGGGSDKLLSIENAIGSQGNDRLVGNGVDNRLDGMIGADTMAGGGGNDTYVVENSLDRVVEAAGGGVDKVLLQGGLGLRYTLPANVENLEVFGVVSAQNTSITASTGNDLNNHMTGWAGRDRLDGAKGADTMAGGGGDDAYVVDDVADVVIEGRAEGIDTVTSRVSYVLPSNVEHLVLGGASSLNGTGNSLANRITGNAGNNTIDGKAGADTMIGGAGNDIYVVDHAGDRIVERSDAGYDSVRSSVSHVLSSGVEALTLTGGRAIDGTGNSLDNFLRGNGAANVLDGRGGTDTMAGGKGNDTYVVDSEGDVIIEAAGNGTDTVVSSSSFTLPKNVEHGFLVATPTSEYNRALMGNDLDNRLTGDFTDDFLDGGAGADTMIGGDGQDAYVVDSAEDVVIEEGADFAVDTVYSSISFSLSSSLENLYLLGAANIDATGNDSDNFIWGNEGNNIIDGGAGADQMFGGKGNDIYIVDTFLDRVSDDSGLDTVFSSSDFFLRDDDGIEELYLLGDANISAWGNSLDNVIAGNAGDNGLYGGEGIDTVSFADASSGVSVNLEMLTASGQGTDLVFGFERIIGSAHDDRLRGSQATDTLTGGAGRDTFVLDMGEPDRITDFVSGQDRVEIDQQGNTYSGVVVVPYAVSGDITRSTASEVIGRLEQDILAARDPQFDFGPAFANGTIFVVNNGATSAILHFTDTTGVEPWQVDFSELAIRGWLDGTTTVAASDFVFG